MRESEGSAARHAIEALEQVAREAAGDSATVARDSFAEGRVLGLFVSPRNPRCRSIDVIAEEHGLAVRVGDRGGFWDLNYTDENLQFASELVEAAIAGRVEERAALGRSRVTVTLPDGTTSEETGYEGCLTYLVPLPGWRRWGALTTYEPYRPDDRGR